MLQVRRTLKTPIGTIQLLGDGITVERILFGNDTSDVKAVREDRRAFAEAAAQLGEYFEGRRREFSFPVKLNTSGFQEKVLVAMRKVKYGRTVSYSQLASMAGSLGASRAVGTACAKNPLPIVFPCHRVVKADGSLGEFGGGPEIKRRLLDLEGADYKEKMVLFNKR